MVDFNTDFRVGDVLTNDTGSEFWIVTRASYHRVWIESILPISVNEDESELLGKEVYVDDDGYPGCYHLPDLEQAREYGTLWGMCPMIRFDEMGRAYVYDPNFKRLYKWDGELVYDPWW